MAGWNKGKKKEEFQSLIERVRSVLGENVAEKTSAKGKAGDTRLLNKVMPALIRLGNEIRNLKLETIPARFSKRGMLIFSGVFIVVLLSWFLYLSPLLKFQAAKTWGDPSPEMMVINGRAWLAENLNIPLDSMSWCYDDKAANCMKYGRLYTWENARDACSFLGEGWRLPTNEEWSDLAMFAGGYYKWEVQDSVADPGKGFQSLAKGGNTGFNILLGGGRDIHGNFDFLEKLGAYWSGTESDSGYYFTYIFLGADSALYQTVAPKESAAYCRCIKD
ncbi:MAG: hypothetical protein H6560_09925 [Lewinellaceae bacterium]|nr:hypothetical protein [Lewinellaceae bacterium]